MQRQKSAKLTESKMLAPIPPQIFSVLTNYQNRYRKYQIRTPHSL